MMRKAIPGWCRNLGLLTAFFFAAACPGEAAPREFHFDFRSQSLHPALKIYGPDAGQVVTPESDGIHFSLPAERQKQGIVGIEPVFRVSGDFEITLGYQILKADPGAAQGVGVNLRAMVGTPMRKAADMARYHRAKEGETFMANMATAVPGEPPERDLNFCLLTRIRG